MDTHEIVVQLCEERGVTRTQIEKELGLGQGTIGKWKKNKPKTDTLQKVADYFGVSMEYLMTGKDTEKKSDSGTSYYFDDESAQYADFLHKNPKYKVLFDASRKVKPEDIDFVAKMIERTANYDD